MYLRDGKKTSCLIATLGTEPQVVTAALDLLFPQDQGIGELIILHTSSTVSAIANAVQVLREEYSRPHHRGKLQFRFIPFKNESGAFIEDVATRDNAYAAFRTIYQVIRAKKQQNARVHLSISGGRKTLALYGMSAAQLLFDEGDCLWYLFSAGEFLSSKRLHPQPGDDVTLVKVPLMLWGQVSPALTEPHAIDDPFEAVKRAQNLHLDQKYNAARTFILGSLTPAERKVVEILALEGLGDQEIGEKLFLSPRTVEQHLRSAYSKAAAHWEVENINRSQLIALLQYFFTTQIRENPHDTEQNRP